MANESIIPVVQRTSITFANKLTPKITMQTTACAKAVNKAT